MKQKAQAALYGLWNLSTSTNSTTPLFVSQEKMDEEELQVSRLHLEAVQQNIPDISLRINPDLQATIQRATQEGRRATVEDFQLGDASFLNALEKDVAKWVHEILKVCCCVCNHARVFIALLAVNLHTFCSRYCV